MMEFEADFTSEEGIELQVPYGRRIDAWYEENEFNKLDKEIIKQNKYRTINWDDQKMFLRIKKNTRLKLAEDNIDLQNQTKVFKSNSGPEYLIGTIESIQRAPRRSTGFIFLKNVQTAALEKSDKSKNYKKKREN